VVQFLKSVFLRENRSFIFFPSHFTKKPRGQIEAVLFCSESYMAREEQLSRKCSLDFRTLFYHPVTK